MICQVSSASFMKPEMKNSYFFFTSQPRVTQGQVFLLHSVSLANWQNPSFVSIKTLIKSLDVCLNR